MDVADDADGSLDPRIQIELENLNNATDDINKLETELDEAHTAFRQLLSESTKRLKDIADKLGSSCIEKARCYYEALEVARQAQVKCQQQAQLFQRASEIHAAAKETVALAEARFMSHQHEWNFDQAWQDMLNHATIKVMDAENQKAECGREHHRRAMLFHDAETRLLQLEEKHRRSIIKARPYFEVKAQCDQMLATQKERVECLQRAIKEAKGNYATSLRTLEEISNRIHQQRQDNDFVANGPREPGVGAELVSPERTSNYELEFNQLNSRVNPASSSRHKDNRVQNYDNSSQSNEATEHLDRRSVDGSEATASQWELELQASMENINNSTLESSIYNSDRNVKSSSSRLCEERNVDIGVKQEIGMKFTENVDLPANALTQFQRLTKNLQALRKPLTNTSLLSQVHGLYAARSVSDSLALSKSNTIFKNSASKSLDSSPVNANGSLEESKLREAEDETAKHVPSRSFEFDFHYQKSRSNSDINLSWNLDISSVEKYQNSRSSNVRHTLDKTDGKEVGGFPIKELYSKEEVSNDLNERKVCGVNSEVDCLSAEERAVKRWPRSNALHAVSHSASSSPAKGKGSLSVANRRLLAENSSSGTLSALENRTSSIRELPVLSLFEKAKPLTDSKCKSCSMINLDEKQNLTLLLDRSRLDIQAVSVERLASARDKLFPKVQR